MSHGGYCWGYHSGILITLFSYLREEQVPNANVFGDNPELPVGCHDVNLKMAYRDIIPKCIYEGYMPQYVFEDHGNVSNGDKLQSRLQPGWISNFISHFTGLLIAYPCWDLS